MNKYNSVEFIKDLAKHILTVLILTLSIQVITQVFSGLYDFRIAFAVVVGRYGYDAIKTLINKIKALQ